MEEIILQRQGVSMTLRASCAFGHIQLQSVGDGKYIWELSYPSRHDFEPELLRGQIAACGKAVPLDMAKTLVRHAIKEKFGIDAAFSPATEAYCYADAKSLAIWPHIASDIYIAAASYEPNTDTIRHEPSNMCLIAFGGGSTRFDIDAGAAKYRAVCEECHAEYLKEHNQRNSDIDNKGWLAWLISETIKERFPDETCRVMTTIVRKSA